ncbi:MAG: hypothetical protein ACSLFR_11100 [Solirubrobacteraceae bacterium]
MAPAIVAAGSRSSGSGNGVANPISPRGGGVHLPFLGATVTLGRYDSARKEWFVRVKAGKPKQPLRLEILACGSRAT